MTTYGLTPEGFNPKTADVIETELVADIKSVPGLEDIQTDAASGWGNLIAILVEREAFIWMLALLIWQSGFRDSSTGYSLDNTVALIGKARREEARSTVPLTLYNRSSTSPVPVPADSQARQGSTGVLWETLIDAEIPALEELYTNLALGDLTYQLSSGRIRAYLPVDTDLSIVAAGDTITLTGCSYASNNGTFTLATVDNAGDWVEFLNPERTDDTDDETNSLGLATIGDVEASVTVDAQSYSAGPFEATPGTIQQIVTPISGWDFVSNLETANVGRLQENDTDLRRRAADETASAQGGTLEAVKQALEKLPGVTYVSALENDTDEEVNGLKRNSMHFTIVGGENQAIWDTIGTKKPAGIGTNGNVAGFWVNSTGDPKEMYFDRVDEVSPYFAVTLTTGTGFPSNGVDLVKQAIVNTTWTHGEDLLNHKVSAAISVAVPGILTIQVYQSRTPAPASSANITILSTEVVNPTLDRITVTV